MERSPADVSSVTPDKTPPVVKTQALQLVETPSFSEYPVMTPSAKSGVTSTKAIIIIASAASVTALAEN